MRPQTAFYFTLYLSTTIQTQAFLEKCMEKFEDLPPNFKYALMNKMHTVQPYWTMLGLKLVDIKKGWAKLKLPYSKKNPTTVWSCSRWRNFLFS